MKKSVLLLTLVALMAVWAIGFRTDQARAVSGGPVVLMNIDAEDGNDATFNGHGGKTPYTDVLTDMLTNVANGGSGILVIGGGKSGTDDVTEFWTIIAGNVGETATFVNGAGSITGQSFAPGGTPFKIIAVASNFPETSSGGLTQAENDALEDRSTDIATHVNDGGGLIGMTQNDMNNKYAYLGDVGAITINAEFDYDNVTGTAEGMAVGIDNPAGNMDVCCWHDTFEDFPPFLEALAFRAGTDREAAIGGAQVIIQGTIDLDPDTDTNFVGTTHTVTATAEDGDPLAPAVGVLLSFEITGGPNIGLDSDLSDGTCSVNADCTTDGSGQVSWTYTSNGTAGTDNIIASFVDSNGDPQTAAAVDKTWEIPPEADVAIVSFEVLNPPAEIDVSSQVDITLRKVVTNNGPAPVVDTLVTKTAIAQAGCDVTPTPQSEPVNGLLLGEQREVLETFTIHCSEPSFHTFTFDNVIEVTSPGVTDPDLSNNQSATSLTVASIGRADSTVESIEVDFLGHDLNPESPEMDLVKSDNLTIAVTSTELNLGPFAADSVITFLADIPAGCEGQWVAETHTMVNYDPAFPLDQDRGLAPTPGKDPGDGVLGTAESATHNLLLEPVGVPIVVTRIFELHCFEHRADLVFHFINKQEVVGPEHVVDPDLSNNFQATRVKINPINLECVETVNPHGRKIPPAGKTTLPGPKGGQNEDGFYQLLAIGAEDFAQIHVLDQGSGTVFGPFAHGDNIKYTQAPGGTPSTKKIGSAKGQAGAVAAHITGNGDAGVFLMYPDGTRSRVVQCLVPPPPK